MAATAGGSGGVEPAALAAAAGDEGRYTEAGGLQTFLTDPTHESVSGGGAAAHAARRLRGRRSW